MQWKWRRKEHALYLLLTSLSDEDYTVSFVKSHTNQKRWKTHHSGCRLSSSETMYLPYQIWQSLRRSFSFTFCPWHQTETQISILIILKNRAFSKFYYKKVYVGCWGEIWNKFYLLFVIINLPRLLRFHNTLFCLCCHCTLYPLIPRKVHTDVFQAYISGIHSSSITLLTWSLKTSTAC